MKKKILIFGASGLLGLNFIKYCKKKKLEIFAHQNKNTIRENGINIVKFDVNNYQNLKKFFSKYKKNTFYVFSFIGMQSVELSEKEKKYANLVNNIINKKISRVSKTYNNQFILISTDHLFDGKKSLYTENSKPNPLNHYSKTKLLGEMNAKKYNSKALIIRTNFLCPSLDGKYKRKNKPSFSDSLIINLKKNKTFSMWNDIYFTPIHCKNLFKYIFMLVQNKAFGIFNLSSDEEVSKYDFAIKTAKLMRIKKKNIIGNKFDNKIFVNRPKSMSLSNKKIKKFLRVKNDDFKMIEQIKLMIKDYN